MDYRQLGLETYGYKCEICSYSIVEVHHINYKEQWDIENKLRKEQRLDRADALLKLAKELGFSEYNFKTKQLAKDDSSTNLAVLCGNCHSLIHRLDVGMNLLKVIDRRK